MENENENKEYTNATLIKTKISESIENISSKLHALEELRDTLKKESNAHFEEMIKALLARKEEFSILIDGQIDRAKIRFQELKQIATTDELTCDKLITWYSDMLLLNPAAASSILQYLKDIVVQNPTLPIIELVFSSYLTRIPKEGQILNNFDPGNKQKEKIHLDLTDPQSTCSSSPERFGTDPIITFSSESVGTMESNKKSNDGKCYCSNKNAATRIVCRTCRARKTESASSATSAPATSSSATNAFTTSVSTTSTSTTSAPAVESTTDVEPTISTHAAKVVRASKTSTTSFTAPVAPTNTPTPTASVAFTADFGTTVPSTSTIPTSTKTPSVAPMSSIFGSFPPFTSNIFSTSTTPDKPESPGVSFGNGTQTTAFGRAFTSSPSFAVATAFSSNNTASTDSQKIGVSVARSKCRVQQSVDNKLHELFKVDKDAESDKDYYSDTDE